MRYYVTLDFKKGPSYGGEVEAGSEAEAKQIAHRDAQLNGFTDPVKKASVRALDQQGKVTE